MKILITGGAGFIGSNLVEELAKDKNNSIVVIDNLSVTDLNLPLLRKWGVEFYKKDIGDFDDIKDIFIGVDTVFHLAEMNRTKKSIQNPIEANRVNIDGTLNCLESAKLARVKKFVFVSSSSVYAGQRDKLLTEEMPLSPLHPYGVGKLAGEHYARIYYSLYNLKTVTLRFFSVYGPRQLGDIDNAAVVPKFINAIMSGETVEVYGDGQQSRNFTYVKDVVDCVIKMSRTEKAVGEIFNVASDEEISVNQLLVEIERSLGKKPVVRYVPALKGDPARNPADISKVRDVVGWVPKVKVSEGIKETISFQLALRLNPVL